MCIIPGRGTRRTAGPELNQTQESSPTTTNDHFTSRDTRSQTGHHTVGSLQQPFESRVCFPCSCVRHLHKPAGIDGVFITPGSAGDDPKPGGVSVRSNQETENERVDCARVGSGWGPQVRITICGSIFARPYHRLSLCRIIYIYYIISRCS